MAKPMTHPVPDALLVHIGDIVCTFALVEANLESLVQTLLGTNPRVGQIVCAETSFRALRGLAVSLYRDRFGADLDGDWKEFRSLVKRAEDAEATRNAIVHSSWASDSDPNRVNRFKITAKERDGRRFVFKSVTADDLRAFAHSLKQLAGDLCAFDVSLQTSGKAGFPVPRDAPPPDAPMD